jgi:hypothetical protein
LNGHKIEAPEIAGRDAVIALRQAISRSVSDDRSISLVSRSISRSRDMLSGNSNRPQAQQASVFVQRSY